MSLWDRVKKALGGSSPPPPPKATGTISFASPPPSDPRPQARPSPPRPQAKPEPPPAASAFLPIARDELLDKAQEARRTTGWMFFGRRDLIPPTADPRTLLIDRGMVTEGYLSPQQLAAMHALGDEWMKYADRVQQIKLQAGQTADAAVEADRAARTELKLKKKAEAAAKRAARAEAVIERKKSNILFVGRGVSARMNELDSDTAKLSEAGLPILHAPSDLAAAMGLTIPRLRWLAYHTEAATRIHYVQFEVPKKSGGTRVLSAPHANLAAAQEWILTNILTKRTVENAAHGFVPGRSTVTNALPHCNQDVVLNADLSDFFPSIGFRRVRHCFTRMGYSGAVATLLALVCTECPRQKVTYAGTVYFVATGPRGLPQGACTSPALSNQIARRLDRRLAGLAAKMGLNYTRYADDLTLSGGTELRTKLGYILARLRHIAEDEGFQVNEKKTRAQRRHTRQTVTGLVVNAAPAVPKPLIRRVRAILHRAKTEGLDAQNRDRRENFHAWLEGTIAYIAMTNPTLGQKYMQMLKNLPAG